MDELGCGWPRARVTWSRSFGRTRIRSRAGSTARVKVLPYSGSWLEDRLFHYDLVDPGEQMRASPREALERSQPQAVRHGARRGLADGQGRDGRSRGDARRRGNRARPAGTMTTPVRLLLAMVGQGRGGRTLERLRETAPRSRCSTASEGSRPRSTARPRSRTARTSRSSPTPACCPTAGSRRCAEPRPMTVAAERPREEPDTGEPALLGGSPSPASARAPAAVRLHPQQRARAARPDRSVARASGRSARRPRRPERRPWAEVGARRRRLGRPDRGRPRAVPRSPAAVVLAAHPWLEAARHELDALELGPLRRALVIALVAARGPEAPPSVTVDARAIGRDAAGTQTYVGGLAWRWPGPAERRCGRWCATARRTSARGARARASRCSARAKPRRASPGPTSPTARSRRSCRRTSRSCAGLGERLVITHLDLISYRNPATTKSPDRVAALPPAHARGARRPATEWCSCPTTRGVTRSART